MAESNIISAAILRSRLAGTQLPSDPIDVIMPPSIDRWPSSVRESLTQSLKPAGVLVPLFERDEVGLSVLLTQRSAELKHHAGQISFPGGRMEPGDADIAATALRETHEEVGIHRDSVSVIGYLEPMPTVTGYAVTPVIGFVDAAVEIAIDRTEVESTFEVPLSFLFDRRNQRIGEGFLRRLHAPEGRWAHAQVDRQAVAGRDFGLAVVLQIMEDVAQRDEGEGQAGMVRRQRLLTDTDGFSNHRFRARQVSVFTEQTAQDVHGVGNVQRGRTIVLLSKGQGLPKEGLGSSVLTLPPQDGGEFVAGRNRPRVLLAEMGLFDS